MISYLPRRRTRLLKRIQSQYLEPQCQGILLRYRSMSKGLNRLFCGMLCLLPYVILERYETTSIFIMSTFPVLQILFDILLSSNSKLCPIGPLLLWLLYMHWKKHRLRKVSFIVWGINFLLFCLFPHTCCLYLYMVISSFCGVISIKFHTWFDRHNEIPQYSLQKVVAFLYFSPCVVHQIDIAKISLMTSC